MLPVDQEMLKRCASQMKMGQRCGHGAMVIMENLGEVSVAMKR